MTMDVYYLIVERGKSKAEGKTVQFPGASKGLHDRISVPRRLVRVWAKDMRQCIESFSQKQIEFLIQQVCGVALSSMSHLFSFLAC